MSSTASEVQKLGPYIVGPIIGEGGFSTVRLGTHEVTGERVALKMLKKSALTLSPAQKAQVEREIATMSKLQHKNVIGLKYVDWNANLTRKSGKELECILVVLELATGGELFEFLAFTGCFEEAIARTYFHQLIDGIAYCHSQGVAHRDLKPENLLLDHEFTLKIADFGLSNVFDTAAQSLMFTECGTLSYMAPEMIRSGKGYDAVKSDIWASGVILFIMLAGFPPFQRPRADDWWFNKLANNKHVLFWQAHARNAYFSDHTKDMINKILTPDAEKRITVEDIRKHPWFNGPVISSTALFAELGRRKSQVDEQKNRDRLELKQAQATSCAPSAIPTGAVGTAATVRDMPDSSPSMTLFGARDAKESTMSLSQAMSQAALGISETATYSPKAFDEKNTIACYTRFESNASPAKILSCVYAALSGLGAKSVVKNEQCKIRSQLLLRQGKLHVTAQIFVLPEAPTGTESNKYAVEVRRVKGDSTSYRTFYQQLRSQLTDIITTVKAKLEISTPTSLSPSASATSPTAADVPVAVSPTAGDL